MVRILWNIERLHKGLKIPHGNALVEESNSQRVEWPILGLNILLVGPQGRVMDSLKRGAPSGHSFPPYVMSDTNCY